VYGAKELLRLAMLKKLKLVNYISTLSIFGPNVSGMSRVVDETTPIDKEKHLFSDGYNASKWVGEKIFLTAGARGVPCNIFRLGLVWADSQQGRYDELQREYRVFKSCLLSGFAIRNYHYESPPTPVDYVARAVAHLGSEYHEGNKIFHITSSAPAEGFFERCNEIAGTAFHLLSAYEWIGEMRRLHSRGHSMPVVPLIEFAFHMDERALEAHQHDAQIRRPILNSDRTTDALQCAGITAPPLDDRLLRVYVESMFSRDRELGQLSQYRQEAKRTKRIKI